MARAAVFLLLAVTGLACSPPVPPPPPRAFRVLEVGPAEAVPLTSERYVTEIPPWVLAGGTPSLVLVSSSSAGACELGTPLGRFDGGEASGCRPLLDGTLDPAISETALAARPHWSRNYAGLFTAHWVETAGQQRLLAVGHGENKNERIDDRVFLNTVNLDVGAECVSGPNPAQGTYDDCWEAYNAFVTLAEGGVDDGGAPLPVEDFGPIAWPAAGYTRGGVKASHGLRHPSSLVHDGRLYVFYEDESFEADDPVRRPGVRVVRAPLSPPPRPGDFFAPVDGAFTEPALPAGYAASRMLDFIEAPGPASPPLFFEPGVDTVRFSVARVRGTRWFLGIEERTEVADDWSIALRLSEDLVTWSAPLFHDGLRAASWDAARLNYPVLLDAEGTTNTEIDADGFFILGTGGSVLHRAWLRLEVP